MKFKQAVLLSILVLIYVAVIVFLAFRAHSSDKFFERSAEKASSQVNEQIDE